MEELTGREYLTPVGRRMKLAGSGQWLQCQWGARPGQRHRGSRGLAAFLLPSPRLLSVLESSLQVCWRLWVLQRNRRERSLEARGWRSGGRQINWILQVFGVFFFDSKKKSISLYHASPARLRSHRFCTPPACERAGKPLPGTKGALRSCDEQEWVCPRTLRRSWVYIQAKKQTLPGIASSFSSSCSIPVREFSSLS